MKKLFKKCILVYPVLPGQKERGHKTLQRLTVHQDFGGEQEKFFLIQLPITSFTCAMDTRALICRHWAYNSACTQWSGSHLLVKMPLRHVLATDLSPHWSKVLSKPCSPISLACLRGCWVAKHRVSGRATHPGTALELVLLGQRLKKLHITELQIDIGDKASWALLLKHLIVKLQRAGRGCMTYAQPWAEDIKDMHHTKTSTSRFP